MACKFKVKQKYQTAVTMIGIYAYNLEEPQRCVYLAACVFYQDYSQAEVQLNASSIIRCIGIVHDGRRLTKSYRQATLISNRRDHHIYNIESGTLLNPPSPLIVKHSKEEEDEISCHRGECVNAPDGGCTPGNQPGDISIRSSDRREELTWLDLTNTTSNFVGLTDCYAEGINQTEIEITCKNNSSYLLVNDGRSIMMIVKCTKLNCKYSRQLNRSLQVICIRNNTAFDYWVVVQTLSTTPKPTTTVTAPSPTTIPLFEPANCAIKYHNLSFAGPYEVRQSNEQKLFLDPTYSLKKVQVKVQADM